MSSKKKRNQADDNGSNRNLDGRRLRTVNDAKALAEYLAVKPEMDKREKEERRKRWEIVVEAAQKREEEFRAGGGKGRVSGQWLEGKEEVEEKTREDITRAMSAGLVGGLGMGRAESESSGTPSAGDDGSESDTEANGVDVETVPRQGARTATSTANKFYGWDEDEDILSDSDGAESTGADNVREKGKDKAT